MNQRIPPSYRVPLGRSEAELRERGSRFFAVVVPSRNETDFKALLKELETRHRDATHLCWGLRLGFPVQERSSDAGEPAGTAGRPIVGALRSLPAGTRTGGVGETLTDVGAVVVRWFGGTKLGKGGLVRAYAGVVRQAVAELPTVIRFLSRRVRVETPYERVGAVQHLVRPPLVELLDQRYGESVVLTLRVAESVFAQTVNTLADLGLEATVVEPNEDGTDSAAE